MNDVLEEARRVDLGAASRYEQFLRWDATPNPGPLRRWYGREWVGLAATHPHLAHLVEDHHLREFGDVLDEPWAVARAAHLDAVDHCRTVEAKHSRGELGDAALLTATAEREILFARAVAERAKHDAQRLADDDPGKRERLWTVSWMEAEIGTIADSARAAGVSKSEVARILRAGVVR